MTDDKRDEHERPNRGTEHWRDRPVEQERDKDIKEGGIEQQQQKRKPRE